MTIKRGKVSIELSDEVVEVILCDEAAQRDFVEILRLIEIFDKRYVSGQSPDEANEK